MDQRMIIPQQRNLLSVKSISDLEEVFKRAGAVTSTVICSSDRVVVYYKDPQTNGDFAADFVDELHIQHHNKAHLLIAVFPVDDS